MLFRSLVALLRKADAWGQRLVNFWQNEVIAHWHYITVGLIFLCLLPICGMVIINTRGLFCGIEPAICLVPSPTPPAALAAPPLLSSAFPLKATPRSVKTGVPPLVIDFSIDSIDVLSTTVKLNITVTRSADKSLNWNSDKGRESEIYLLRSGQRFKLLEMGGLFAQDTTLQPRQSYKGWFTFEKPTDNLIVFVYPDVQPVPIDLNSSTSR